MSGAMPNDRSAIVVSRRGKSATTQSPGEGALIVPPWLHDEIEPLLWPKEILPVTVVEMGLARALILEVVMEEGEVRHRPDISTMVTVPLLPWGTQIIVLPAHLRSINSEMTSHHWTSTDCLRRQQSCGATISPPHRAHQTPSRSTPPETLISTFITNAFTDFIHASFRGNIWSGGCRIQHSKPISSR